MPRKKLEFVSKPEEFKPIKIYGEALGALFADFRRRSYVGRLEYDFVFRKYRFIQGSFVASLGLEAMEQIVFKLQKLNKELGD